MEEKKTTPALPKGREKIWNISEEEVFPPSPWGGPGWGYFATARFFR